MSKDINITEKLLKEVADVKFDRIIDFTDLFDIYLSYTEGLESKKVFLGYPGIDRALGGIRPYQLVTILAGPSVGKTQLSMNILRNQVLQKSYDPDCEQILFYSLETTEEEIAERLIQMEMDMWTSEVEKKAEAKDEEFITSMRERIKRYKSIKAIVYRIPIDELRYYAMALEKLNGKKIKVSLVDYLGLIRNDKQFNEYGRTTDTVQKLKEMPLIIKSPVIALSQVTREANKDKKVTVTSGKGSGEIEQSSNIVLTLTKLEDSQVPKEAQAMVEKEKIEFLKLKIEKKKQGKFAESLIVLNKKNIIMQEYVVLPEILQKQIESEEEPF